MMEKYTIKGYHRSYHHESMMSKAKVMLIMIPFHDSGYRCLKHSYLVFVSTTTFREVPGGRWPNNANKV